MSVKTRAQLITENNTDFPDNITQLISPADLRGQMNDTADSALFAEDIPDLDLSDADVTSTGSVTKTLAEWADDIEAVGDTIPSGEFSYGTAGAITWPVVERMKEQIYLLDFIPLAVHPYIRDMTAATVGHANFYDCSDAIDAAMASVTVDMGNYYAGGPEIIFPYGKCYFSRTIEMKKTMTFTGHGQGGRNGWGTILQFAPNITGITVNSLTTYQGTMVPMGIPVPNIPENTKGGDASTIRHLRLQSDNVGVPNPALNSTGHGIGNGVGHGIWCRSRCNIEHVGVQYFPQNGFYVRATAQAANTPEGAAVYGNANETYIAHCSSLSNGGCGLYVEGSDTNNCLFMAIDCGSNKGSAVFDSSFIGNVHIAHQANSNGSLAWCTYAITPGVTQCATYYCKDAFRANNSATAWAASTGYVERQYVRSSGNLYRCTNNTFVTSGSTAPTGTAASVSDGGATWAYVSSDAGIQIPPAGHAQSEAVWGFLGNIAGPVGTIYNADPYSMFPNNANGTPKTYRVAYTYWTDQIAAGNIFIGMYGEGGQPPSNITAPSMSIGGEALPPNTGGSIGMRTTGNMVIRQGLELPLKVDATNPRNSQITFSRQGGAALTLQVAPGKLDNQGLVTTATDLSWNWHEPSGNWVFQTARLDTKIAQSITTDLNTTVFGRAAPITSGMTSFPSGLWLGSRYQSYVTLGLPTSGEYAAGDMLFNGAPTGVSSPVGWVCTTGGAITATNWAASTNYVMGAIVNNGGSAYVCVDPGTSFSVLSAWVADTSYAVGTMRLNGANPYVCKTAGYSSNATPWATSTAYAVNQVRLNNGESYKCYIAGTSASYAAWAASTVYAANSACTNGGNFYKCMVAGTSAASGGPTGTDPVNQVTDGTAKWLYVAVQGPTGTAVATQIFDGTMRWLWTPTTPATGPAGTGFSIADGTVVWDYLSPTTGDIQPWAQSTYYGYSAKVVNGGTVYVNSHAGTSAATGSGPSGAGGVDAGANWTVLVPVAMTTTGPAGTGGYILDGTAAWAYKPPFVFTPVEGKLSQQTISDGLAFTLTPGTSPRNTFYTGTITADRAVTLVTTNALKGSYFRITRTAAGAFNLNVGTGPLKALGANSWCEVTYDGTAWYLSSYGILTADTDSLDTLIPPSGGAVTQLTSKATGVTLNKICGQITTAADALAATTAVSFTLTNSKIAAVDIIQLSMVSGATAGAYTLSVDNVFNGSCVITIYNRTVGALSQSLVINFAVIKGSIT